MSKTTIEFDSIDKTMEVSLDGKKLDADYVTLYRYKEHEYGNEPKEVATCCIELKPSKNDGVLTYQRICASNQVKSDDVISSASDDKTLVVTKNNKKVNEAFSDWLCKKNENGVI